MRTPVTQPWRRIRPPRWTPPDAKRVMDVVLGSLLLALAAPLMIGGAMALTVRRRPGGVLSHSPRTGLGGRTFVLHSLRTHRFGLDTLSRLPHVVRGDLSLVGPAPQHPDTGAGGAGGTEGAPGAGYWRHDLKPGLTGLAQVRARSGMPWDEPALLDQHYAEHHWVGLDLAILAAAALAPVRTAIREATRRGKANLSDTDHRVRGYSAAE